MTDVLTALGHQWEPVVATTLERVAGVTVARRCADVAELLSVSEAGLGEVAVVSADLRGLDLQVVKRLHDRMIRVVGIHPPDDEASERRLHQLGVGSILPCDAGAERFAAVLAQEPAHEQLEAAWSSSGPDDGTPAPPHGEDEGMPSGPDSVPWRPAGAQDAGTAGRHTARPAGAGRHTAGPAGGRRQTMRRRTWPLGARRRPSVGVTGPQSRAPARAPVVAVWGPAGAPGRTTIATTLAAELALRGGDVLLVDADTYGGSVAQALGLLDEAPGVAAACRAADHGTLDLPTLARLAPEAFAGLRVLTGLPRPERWPEVRAGALERVLELGRELVDVVVVDCGFCVEDDEELSYDTLAPRRNEATLTSLKASDFVVAVGRADPVGLERFVRGLQELRAVPSGEPVPVVNRVRSTAVGARPQARIAESLLRFAGIQGVRFVPDDPAGLDAALLAGRSVVEHTPGSPVRFAVAEIATAVAPWTAPAEPERSGRSRRSGRSWPRRLGSRRPEDAAGLRADDDRAERDAGLGSRGDPGRSARPGRSGRVRARTGSSDH